MANCLTVKFRVPKHHKPPTSHNLAHISGITPAVYWLDKAPKLLQTRSFKNIEEVDLAFTSWMDDAKQRYTESHTNALRNDACIVEELLLIIGKDVVELDQATIMSIIQDFIEDFEDTHNTKVLHWSYHMHEGHVNEYGDIKINRHAHILFDNINNNGFLIRRKLPRRYFSEIQDKIFEISQQYIPNLERAQKSEYKVILYKNREMLVNVKPAKSHKRFRQEKEQESAVNQETKKLYRALEIIQANQNKLYEIFPDIPKNSNSWFENVMLYIQNLYAKNKKLRVEREKLVNQNIQNQHQIDLLQDQLDHLKGLEISQENSNIINAEIQSKLFTQDAYAATTLITNS